MQRLEIGPAGGEVRKEPGSPLPRNGGPLGFKHGGGRLQIHTQGVAAAVGRQGREGSIRRSRMLQAAKRLGRGVPLTAVEGEVAHQLSVMNENAVLHSGLA